MRKMFQTVFLGSGLVSLVGISLSALVVRVMAN